MNTSKFLKSSLILISFCACFSFRIAEGQQAIKKRDLDVVYIGNSITQGVQLKDPKTEAPPAASSKYLGLQKGIGDVEFINQGRSGYTTVDFLPDEGVTLNKVIEATNEFHKVSQRLLIFSISLGTNDSAEKGPKGSPVSPDSYQQNLKTIADKLLSEFPGCRIFFQQPIWYSPNTYNGSKYMAEGLSRLQTYFPELHSLVEKYSKTNPGQVFLGDQKGFNYFRKNHLTDLIPESGKAGTFYLHPNKKGADVLGKLWGEAIYKQLVHN